MSLYLVGYMGAGKSTLGKALADEWQIPFIDLDTHIEQITHQTVRRLFRLRGETAYRRLESHVLHRVGLEHPSVIATGGGAPCFNDNMTYMNRIGITVFLETGLLTLLNRLYEFRVHRPLLDGMDFDQLRSFICMQLDERLPYYRLAQYTVSGDRLETVGQIKDTVKSFPLTKEQIIQQHQYAISYNSQGGRKNS